MRTVWTLLLSSLSLVGCKSRPETERAPAAVASSLVDDVSPLDEASALAADAGQEAWRSGACEVVPEEDRGASFSDLTFTGECAFTHHGPATCRARGDDYYAIIRRRLRDGSALELYLNVEFYTGPGTYDRKVELLGLIRRGQTLYRWSNLEATVTLGFAEGGMSPATRHPEQASAGTPTLVNVPPIVLVAEPGTATSGSIRMSGTIGCVLKELPR